MSCMRDAVGDDRDDAFYCTACTVWKQVRTVTRGLWYWHDLIKPVGMIWSRVITLPMGIRHDLDNDIFGLQGFLVLARFDHKMTRGI